MGSGRTRRRSSTHPRKHLCRAGIPVTVNARAKSGSIIGFAYRFQVRTWNTFEVYVVLRLIVRTISSLANYYKPSPLALLLS